MFLPGCCLLPGGFQIFKYFAVHEFIPHPTVKTLGVAILPGTARFNIQRLHAKLFQPIANRIGDEFTAVVTPNMFRHAVRLKQFSQDIDHILAGNVAIHLQRQTLSRILV